MTRSTKLSKACNSYKPQKRDPVICDTCLWSWGAHSADVQSVFTAISSSTITSLIHLRWKYVSAERPDPCTELRPHKYGEDLSICDCGRFQHEHNLKVQIRYREKARQEFKPIMREADYMAKNSKQCRAVISTQPGLFVNCLLDKDHFGPHKHDDDHGICAIWDGRESTIINKRKNEVVRKSTNPCTKFEPLVDRPGTCRWCQHQYISHSEPARGFLLEDLEHLHSGYCKSVTRNGQHPCDCLTDANKQRMLDTLNTGKGVPCKKFDPLEENRNKIDLCRCGRRFYDHWREAKGGFLTWTEWRASHMSNKEIIDWFMNLGPDDASRMKKFKHHLDHPSHLHPEAPSPSLIKLMWEMLPLTLRKLAGDSFAEKVLKTVTPSSTSDNERCYECGGPLSMEETIVCKGCVSLNTKMYGNLTTQKIAEIHEEEWARAVKKDQAIVAASHLASELREVAPESTAEDHDE